MLKRVLIGVGILAALALLALGLLLGAINRHCNHPAGNCAHSPTVIVACGEPRNPPDPEV